MINIIMYIESMEWKQVKVAMLFLVWTSSLNQSPSPRVIIVTKDKVFKYDFNKIQTKIPKTKLKILN